MKKTIFISLGIILILLIGGIWAYLLIFGAPENPRQIFSNFGIGGNRGVAPVETAPVVDVASGADEGAPQRLRQLTTRPVAGAVFTDTGIRYVEKGTGHAYDIDLSTGTETLVSGTTIPQAVEAIFSKSGSRVAITAEQNGERSVVVGTISRSDDGSGVLDGISLPDGAREVAFSQTGDSLYYALKTPGGSEGHLYTIAENTDTLVFRIPLRDIEALWGEDIYIYTTPSAEQTGHLYEVVGDRLNYVQSGAPGLMALGYEEGIIVSHTAEEGLVTVVREDAKTNILPISAFPEKCTDNPGATSTLYCADPLEVPSGSYPDDWYKGVVSFSDSLWEVSTQAGDAFLLSDFAAESGRQIDVAQIGTNANGSYIWFINKNDDTLWMFDTTL